MEGLQWPINNLYQIIHDVMVLVVVLMLKFTLELLYVLVEG